MKKWFMNVMGAVFVVLFMSTIASATIQSIDLNGLSEAQRAQIALQAAQLKNEGKAAVGKGMLESIGDLKGIGEKAGIEFLAFTEKVGVAADKLLSTDTGKWMLAIILWFVAGKDMIYVVHGFVKFFVGTGLFFILFPFWVYYFRNLCLTKSVKTIYTDAGKKKEKIVERFKEGEVDGLRFIMLIILGVIILGSTLTAIA